MHFLKPSWLSHSGEQKDFEIYSCHVSPDGKRLATAGGDGHVRIWSTEAILNCDNPSYSKPRQLSHMSHHLGTIHSVRFSPNGQYLASGADDKLICIYHLDSSPPSHATAFGSNEPPPVENWKTYKRLIGHDNDVQDLAWSNDNSLLISVGLDSKIVIWSGHTFEKLKTLAAHQSHVKGITFDPANKYFATASDDRTLKIFRFTPPAPNATQHDTANDFILENTISQPFKSSPLTTYFRRCSWSPDGNHIAAANAVNGPVNSVAIIERGRWDSEINLIGHEGPTEVCAFSPRLFHTSAPPENSSADVHYNLITVIASAGQDKTLTVWNTNTSRPLVICEDVSSKSISDLAWTPDGQTLFASSLDGTIVALTFSVGELGWVAKSEENDKALQKYGASRKGMGLAEDVDGMRLEIHSKAGELRGAESRMGALMGDFGLSAPPSSAPATNGVKPSNTTATTTNPAASNPAAHANRNLSQSKETSDQKDEKEESTPAENATTEETADKTAQRIAQLKSRVSITRDGKRRVAPLLVSSSGTGQSSLPQSQLVGATNTARAGRDEPPQTILDLSKPYEGLPRGGLAAMLFGNKRKAVALRDEEDEDEDHPTKRSTGPIPIMANGIDGVEAASLTPPAQGCLQTPEFIRPAVLNPSLSMSQLRLAVPKIRSSIVRPLEKGVLLNDTTPEDAARIVENTVLEVRNSAQVRHPSRILATKRGLRLWQDFLPRAVILAIGNVNFWAAACEDGSVYAWTPAGRRLINAIIVESQPVRLESRENFLLCVTAVGMCHVWNIHTLSSPHPPVSLAPILEIATASLNQHTATPAPGIISAHLNSQGNIIIALTNGDGYYYSPLLYSWQRLSESWWAVGSQYWNSNDSSISALQSTAVGSVTSKESEKPEANVSAGIIPYLERHTTTEFLLKGRAYTLQRMVKSLLSKDGFEEFESSVSIAHLENRIAGALQLGSREEFRLFLFMYAKRIGAEGHRGKVEELLNTLVGGVLQGKHQPGDKAPQGRGWFSNDGLICGWDRRVLLQGVVMILGKFRELQRLTVQFARILDLTQDPEDDSDGQAMAVDS